jgi:hypothetical protein
MYAFDIFDERHSCTCIELLIKGSSLQASAVKKSLFDFPNERAALESVISSEKLSSLLRRQVWHFNRNGCAFPAFSKIISVYIHSETSFSLGLFFC